MISRMSEMFFCLERVVGARITGELTPETVRTQDEQEKVRGVVRTRHPVC